MLLSMVCLAMQPNSLDQTCQAAVDAAVVSFKEDNLHPYHVSITVFELGSAGEVKASGSYRGDQSFYPASVVKMFYMGYAAKLMNDGTLKPSKEDTRAFSDMIKDSSNDATGHVLDLVTGTTGGPELSETELKEWMQKRQVVNNWLKTRGIEGVNACQKTWNEGPYGRERQGYGPNFELRNAATTDSCAKFMVQIATGQIGGNTGKKWMLDLLKRDLRTGDSQTKGYIGDAFPGFLEHYSKAGLAYQNRHDVAYNVWSPTRRTVLCIFTDQHLNNEKLLPFLASKIFIAMDLPAKEIE